MKGILLAALFVCALASPDLDKELLQAASVDDVEQVRSLLKAGASPNAKFVHDFISWTAVQMAARAGFVDVLKVLLDSGANPAEFDPNGDTALHMAVREGHEKIVDLLLSRGMSPNAVLKPGHATPVYVAARHPNMHILESLLKAKGDPNSVVGHDSGTAMHTAAREGHADAIARLKKYGGNIEALDSYKFTPLIVACAAGQTAAAHQLLQLGANVNAQDHLGGTCLFRASQSGHSDTVTTVLEYNPRLDLADVGGRTAKDVASEHASELIAEHESKLASVEVMAKWLTARNMADIVSQLKSAGIFSLKQLRVTSEEKLEALNIPPRRRQYIHSELRKEAHSEL